MDRRAARADERHEHRLRAGLRERGHELTRLLGRARDEHAPAEQRLRSYHASASRSDTTSPTTTTAGALDPSRSAAATSSPSGAVTTALRGQAFRDITTADGVAVAARPRAVDHDLREIAHPIRITSVSAAHASRSQRVSRVHLGRILVARSPPRTTRRGGDR
jgi:hypothetical protein